MGLLAEPNHMFACKKCGRKKNTMFNPSGSKSDWYCKMCLIREVQRLREKIKSLT